MNNSTDLNESLSTLITNFNANRESICDSQCQDSNNISKLQADVAKAQINVQSAPSNLLNAQRKLSTYDTIYKTTFDKNIQKMAEKKMEKLTDEFYDIKENIEQYLNYYDTQIYFKNNMREVKQLQDKNINKINKNIAASAGNLAVNRRLANFYFEETTLTDWTISYLEVIYWILFVIQVASAMRLIYSVKTHNKGNIILSILLLAILPLYQTLAYILRPVIKALSLFPTP